MLKKQEVEAEEERLRALASSLPDAERKDFYRQASRALKDPDTYAVLNWFFLAGLHQFYLGRWGRGGFDLGTFLAGILLILSGSVVAGIGLMILITLVELWALFRAQIIVQDWNNRIYRRLLERYRSQPG